MRIINPMDRVSTAKKVLEFLENAETVTGQDIQQKMAGFVAQRMSEAMPDDGPLMLSANDIGHMTCRVSSIQSQRELFGRIASGNPAHEVIGAAKEDFFPSLDELVFAEEAGDVLLITNLPKEAFCKTDNAKAVSTHNCWQDLNVISSLFCREARAGCDGEKAAAKALAEFVGKQLDAVTIPAPAPLHADIDYELIP